MSTNATELTIEQKHDLYRDGYIVLKNLISREMVEAARKRLAAQKKVRI